MEPIDKQAEFYRAYLPQDRDLVPMAVAMGIVLAVGLFLYVLGVVAPIEDSRVADRSGARPAAAFVSGPAAH